MHRIRRNTFLIVCALSLGVACEDPAASAPAARVESAATPTEPAPSGQPAGEPGAAPANDARQALTIDAARSSVGFTGSKVTDSHTGTFSTFSGTMRLDPAAVEASSVQITIQMDSVQIEPDRLRGHLLSPDLFDVAQFPTATFQSTRIVAGGEGGTHTVTGNLTLHGQTRAITFPANITVSDAEVHATAEFTINRRDFGIVYPGMPDDLIRDGVVIRFDVRAPRG
jgi:polyisoprenoid-binding protein YceI